MPNTELCRKCYVVLKLRGVTNPLMYCYSAKYLNQQFDDIIAALELSVDEGTK